MSVPELRNKVRFRRKLAYLIRPTPVDLYRSISNKATSIGSLCRPYTPEGQHLFGVVAWAHDSCKLNETDPKRQTII